MKYAAFFRGINVGGRNKVKMKELSELFIEEGFSEVKTYIQSGNVIFSSDKEELVSYIEEAFEKKFCFSSKTILRTQEEIEEILTLEVFSDEEILHANQSNPEVVHEYVYLCQEEIDKEEVQRMLEKIETQDLFFITKREIYLLVYDSVHKSKLAATLGKIDLSLSARNRKTLTKVLEMMQSM